MLQSAPVGIVVREVTVRQAVSLINDRQRRYGLRPLVAPRTQPVREILVVTMQEGGGNWLSLGAAPE